MSCHLLNRKGKQAFGLLIILIICTSDLYSQYKVSGQIKESENEKALHHSSVSLMPGNFITETNAEGFFELANVPEGNYSLKISHLGYSTHEVKIELHEDKEFQILLRKTFIQHGEITISAIRSLNNSGFAFTDLNKNDIQKNNTGVDLPFLLQLTPSLVTTSDAGTGIGYTGLRIRGSDASRINVTMNGVPLNDAESHNVYFVDLPDLASSVENIQIQRGVGTSTNGAGSFGGSVNIMTNRLNPEPYASTSHSIGSFNTIKNNLSLGTGLLRNHWGFEGRLSRIKSDGYIDRATADLNSWYVSGGYFAKKSLVKLTIFSGKEITYQAWNGVPENLLNIHRTYNSFTYENQVDNYRQDHYQLLLGYDFLKDLHVQLTIHTTRGKGFYEEFKYEDDFFGNGNFSTYGLPDLIVGTDTISATDLVRKKWLDNIFYGSVFAVTYEPKEDFKLTLGGAWNQYQGEHFGEITWARFAGNTNPGEHYEDDNGFKTDFNVYIKCYYKMFKKIDLTGDMQIRMVDYHFTGLDVSATPVSQKENLVFYNPKLGINWMIHQSVNWYASISRGSKEPSRDDYTESTPGSRPDPELLTDFESGLRYKSSKLSAGINYYYMHYTNQLVLTGRVNDVGNYTRTNVPKSYRQGIEAEFIFMPFTFLSLTGNTTLSSNKIIAIDEYIDNYDTGTQQQTSHQHTQLAFSPSLICSGMASLIPVKNLTCDFIIKHVGKQYLDNTTNNQRKINDYTVCDIRISYSVPFKWIKDIQITLVANNIFSKKYVSNGYTFSYISGGNFVTENYFYPQAPANFMTQLTLNF